MLAHPTEPAPAPSPGPDHGARVGVDAVVLTGVAIAAGCVFFPATIDDAFISGRYAQNLVAGDGLVFNPGERVEGYSNPLWVLLLAALLACGLPAIAAVKVVGIAGLVAIVLGTRWMARALGLPRIVAMLVGIALATDVGLAFHATSGMETIGYALFAFGVAVAAVRGSLALASVCTAAAVLCRPDGLVLLLPMALVSLPVWRRRPFRALALTALPSGALAAWSAFRLAYYRQWVPNTFEAKASAPPGVRSSRYLDYLGSFATDSLLYGILGAAAVLGAVLLLARPPSRLAGRPSARLALVAWVPCLHLIAWVGGGDWMAYHRFLLPSLPVTLVLAALALHRIEAVVGARPAALLTAGVLTVAVAGNVARIVDEAERVGGERGINPAMHSRRHVALARLLDERFEPGSTIVFNEVGAVAYHTDHVIVDMLGLTDRGIVRAYVAGDAAEYLRQIALRGPDAILVNDRQRAGDEGMALPHALLYEFATRSGLFERTETFALDADKNVVFLERTDARVVRGR